MNHLSISYLTRTSAPLFLSLAVLFCTGCGKKEEPEDITDLCKEDCESYASSCPEGSLAKETEDACKFFCIVFEDTKECRDKWKERRECMSDYAVDCDTGSIDDDGACDASGEPFTIDFSEEGASGECVSDNVSTN